MVYILGRCPPLRDSAQTIYHQLGNVALIMDYNTELKNYLDEEGRLKEWPSKRNKGKFQSLALEYLASKFETGVTYTEKEVNAILQQHHTFGDHAMLR